VSRAQDVILAGLADGPATTSQLYDRLGYPLLLRLQLIDYRAFRDVIGELERDKRITGEPDENGTIWSIPEPPGASANG
jgi:hypothetical protein